MLRSVPDFIWDLLTNLAGYVTGGVVMAVIWVWEHKHNRNLSWKASKWVLRTFLATSCFSVWYSERPDLTAEIELKEWGSISDHSSAVLLTVEAKNTAAPSVVTGWRLILKTHEGIDHKGTPIAITEPINLLNADGAVIKTYSASDGLNEKAFRQPIQQGSAITGILRYYFPDLGVDALKDSGTKYILNFVDVRGKEHLAVDSAHDPEAGGLLFPGLAPK